MVVPKKTRAIAVIAGLVNAAFAVAMSIVFPLTVAASALLIAGAIAAGRFPRQGRNLIWFGAFFTSLFAIPMNVFIGVAFTRNRALDQGPTFWALVSTLLIALCDVVVVMDERRAGRTLPAADNALLSDR